MNQKRRMAIGIIILCMCLLWSCSGKQKVDEVELPVEPQEEVPVEEDIIEQPAVLSLHFQPENLVLAPAYKYKITLNAMLSDDRTVDYLKHDEAQFVFRSSHPEYVQIDEQGIIEIMEEAPIGQSVTIEALAEQLMAQMTVTVSYALDETVIPSDSGIDEVTNPDSIAVIVNKERSLPPDYEPDDLVKPDVPFSFAGENERKYLRQEAAEALESLFAQAEADGIELTAVSGYRTYRTQEALFNYYVQQDGEAKARQYSAYPGTSEHQTGLTMDVSSPSINNVISTEAGFEETEAGKWLAEHAPHFGFIIRYPEGKEHITGYVYEPWHIRYVGLPLAQLLSEHDLTLEEFFASTIPVSSNVE